MGRGHIVRRPVAIDLFAGAGGLSVGLEQAGFDVAAAVEYDPVHAATHAFNFPLAKVLCRDVTTLTGDELREACRIGVERVGTTDWDGEVDLVAGGPPCQGFSMIGKRQLDDPRNRLPWDFHRLVAKIRPRYFLMENVPGMMTGLHSGILARLIEAFERDGYVITKPVRLLDASAFGVPQDRRRLFLLGSRSDQKAALYPPPRTRSRGKQGAPEGNSEAPLTVSVGEAVGDLPDVDRFEELLETDAADLTLQQQKESARRASAYVRRLRGEDSVARDLSYPRRWNRASLTSSRRTVHTPLSVMRFSATEPGETEPVSRFHRLHPDGVCNTIRAGTGSERGAFTSPRPIHPTLPRVISVREAARLHSFPDWFRLHSSKWHGFRQVGNAVCPLVGQAVGEVFVNALGIAPPKPGKTIRLGDEMLLALNMSEAARHFEADPSAIPAQRRRAGAAVAAAAD
jgi:DNA (cytosine-5)-methyltransferase 1